MGIKIPQDNHSTACILTKDIIYDCLGIGFGPANIALAIALEERGLLKKSLFLERSSFTDWNPEMLMPGVDIQHNPLRDFITPRNPTSQYGFLSYLKAHDRLFQFLNLDAPFPPRSEYAEYVKWVAAQFDAYVAYGCTVANLDIEVVDGQTLYRVRTSDDFTYLAKSISFAPGRTPNIPSQFKDYLGDNLAHLTNYNSSINEWTGMDSIKSIVVIGASQSAAEIILDIHAKNPDYEVTCISRSFGFKLKDTSPFTEEIYEPDFVDYFYNSDIVNQKELRSELLRSNYGSADHDVIAKLQMILYEQSVHKNEKVKILNNRLIEVFKKNSSGQFVFNLRDKHSNKNEFVTADAVVLATGFLNYGNTDGDEVSPELLDCVLSRCRKREDGTLSITRNYALESIDSSNALNDVSGIHLNGVCESTHGFGDAGSFSLLSIRSNSICNSIEASIDSKSADTVINRGVSDTISREFAYA